jgi:hypothetical protein
MGLLSLSGQGLVAMSDETTENFWKVFNEWKPEPPRPVFYRLYYDDQGRPVTWTMEDLPGNYIDIDLALYQEQPRHIVVRNGKIVRVDPAYLVPKLRPSIGEGIPCHPSDVAIIVEHNQPHTLWRYGIDEAS